MMRTVSRNEQNMNDLERNDNILKPADRALRAVADATPVLIAYIDTDQRYTFVNNSYARWIGRPPSEIIGKRVIDIVGESFYNSIQARLHAALSGETSSFEVSFPSESQLQGSEVSRYLTATYVPDIDADGRVAGVVATIHDITPIRKIEHNLRRSERQLRDFVENGTVPLHWVGPDGTILWANKAEMDLLGYTEEEYIGRPISDFHADPHVINDILLRLGAKEVLHNYEARLKARDGSIKHVLINSNVLWDEADQFVHTRCFTRDITERKVIEETLRESEERNRAVLEQVSEAIFLLEPDTKRFVDANPAFQRLVDYTLEELKGMLIYDVLPYERERIDRAVQRALIEGDYHVSDRLYRRRNGSLVNVEVSITPVYYGGKKVLCQIVRDITERKRIEESLLERARMSSFIADVGIALTQSDTLPSILHRCTASMVQHLDAAFARIWVYDKEEKVLELSASSGLYTHLDGDHSRVPLGKFKIGKIAAERTPHLTNNVIGDPRVHNQEWAAEEGMVSFAGYPLIVADQLVGVMAMFGRRPLSESLLQVMASISNGIALGIQRKQSEEERDELLISEQEARAATEAALGMRDELLAVVSHDLKNPLAAIKGNTQLLKRRIEQANMDAPERFASVLTRIDQAQAKMNMLIDELIDFGRLQANLPLTLQRRSTDIVALVRQVVSDQRPITDKHKIRVKADVPALIGWWDADRIERVIANFLSNAIKYSPGGGNITVEVSEERGEAENPPDDLPTQHSAVVSVRDEGLGIPPEDLPHIFEWFRRASSVSSRISGAGIGLASSLHTIKQHGGTITVESEPGVGSCFTARLPVRSAEE